MRKSATTPAKTTRSAWARESPRLCMHWTPPPSLPMSPRAMPLHHTGIPSDLTAAAISWTISGRSMACDPMQRTGFLAFWRADTTEAISDDEGSYLGGGGRSRGLTWLKPARALVMWRWMYQRVAFATTVSLLGSIPDASLIVTDAGQRRSMGSSTNTGPGTPDWHSMKACSIVGTSSRTVRGDADHLTIDFITDMWSIS
mmetsp:Transcript_46243/g.100267  ORF Transcript_46243/g.100267 Transcript_46243/m.100267 type:complete len:200 (+) Transcript_46243:694-1293(+)